MKPTRKQRKRERRAAARHGLTLEAYRRQGRDDKGHRGYDRWREWQRLVTEADQ